MNPNDTKRLTTTRAEALRTMQRIGESAGDRELTHAQAEDYQKAFDVVSTVSLQMGERVDSAVAETLTGDEAKAMAETIGNKSDRITRPAQPSRSPRDADIVLKSGDKLEDRVQFGSWDTAPGLTMTSFLKGIITGDWGRTAAGVKTLAVGSGSAGGYLVPDPLSSRIIDMARARARVIEAGAITVPMDSPTLNIARVAQGPNAQWKLENAAATASDLTFERVTLSAKTLVGLSTMSVELAEDGADIGQTIDRELSAALALELDRAALRGSGVDPEPRGIRNTSGVAVQSMGANGAALTSYDAFSTAVQTVQAANSDAVAVIYSPRVAGSLDRLKDTTGQPLRPPPSFEGLKRYVTAQLPVNLTQGTASDASEAYIGDFSQLMIGMRTQLIIEASRDSVTGTSNAWTQLQVHVRAYLRADIAVLQPSAFAVITGIRP